MMIEFSQKQKEVWRNTIISRHRWNVSLGATRSGKTYLDYFKIPYRIRSAPDNGLILLLGNTKGTLERNILEPMRRIWTSGLVGIIGSDNKVDLFGRECYALGADKVNQVSKLQGAGLAYCYGDEITTWHEDVFQMLKSRLDKPGACFDGTCNPDNPGHWFKAFLDSDADIYQTPFVIDDNPFLDPDFVKSLKREYVGTVYYDRFILGKWKRAEGLIYPQFADNTKRFLLDDINPDDVIYAVIGVDFGGTKSAHSFTLTGFTQRYKQIVVLDEWYRPNGQNPLSPEQLSDAFVDFAKRAKSKYKVFEAFCDSAEQTLIQGLTIASVRAGLQIDVRNARKGPINDRIMFYNSLIGQNRLKVLRHCKALIRAMQDAVYDDKFKGGDRRLDDGTTNIDSLDSLEYSTETVQQDIIYLR